MRIKQNVMRGGGTAALGGTALVVALTLNGCRDEAAHAEIARLLAETELRVQEATADREAELERQAQMINEDRARLAGERREVDDLRAANLDKIIQAEKLIAARDGTLQNMHGRKLTRIGLDEAMPVTHEVLATVTFSRYSKGDSPEGSLKAECVLMTSTPTRPDFRLVFIDETGAVTGKGGVSWFMEKVQPGDTRRDTTFCTPEYGAPKYFYVTKNKK